MLTRDIRSLDLLGPKSREHMEESKTQGTRKAPMTCEGGSVLSWSPEILGCGVAEAWLGKRGLIILPFGSTHVSPERWGQRPAINSNGCLSAQHPSGNRNLVIVPLGNDSFPTTGAL